MQWTTVVRDSVCVLFAAVAWDYRLMRWQEQVVRRLAGRLPQGAALEVVGSAADGVLVDGWSDLDLHLRLPGSTELADLLDDDDVVWAVEANDSADGQVVRTVMVDGRRIDFLVEVGRLLLPALAADNEVRFLAALAMSKLGRGDRLIGGHVVLELLQACLVQAMLLRDSDEKSCIHRTGTARDALASEVFRLAQLPLEVADRPNVVEQVVSLYGQWRHEREAGYERDWSGLTGVLLRGLSYPADGGGGG